MKTAIALRHIHFEDVGTLDAVIAEQGYELRYLDPTLDALDSAQVQQAHLLIVLGGPIGAYDEQLYPFLQDELALVRQRLQSGKPMLGICLGAQLIARALGAKVYPLGVKEIGFSPLTLTPAGQDSLLAKLEDTPVLHWHGDQFDIPEGGVHLASTAVGAHQAFAVGRNVLGLQFHLEADVRKLEQWLVGHASELAQAGIDPCALRAAAAACGDRLTRAARAVLSDWLNNLDDHASA
ncbi:glutamine amidotransferase [Pseudomonas sp. FW306-02-F02-AA]|uniref:Glutamine amidotransferase n=1 Tax=Pseudomonas fluorescens TaxID=294 RepID=A0A0N9WIQ8_PSEFL|nr:MULTISPECIES: glutamine amidotransferase [Pseudomonas]ALI01491.1 glutamine amidotransferase [Pseudomonas fluorescens]PMZ05793.1 glutamine amidotransferase [Pseudomonas sp. FW306-02-F02-AB]PMZ11363.1 glutamine amidotransferase [Pseudomonas sp. FW306-02-H06C]PMZ17286.1 glutamine amidotransferase [Pseudomonas sp. FW306-02-F02-AA]PMZ23003.1 glutamine amidotransferase [Pseudomonas sp. FW306-02-F08-AA]